MDVYAKPTYESNADTSSIKGPVADVSFIRLTNVQIQSDKPDGTIVGVLVLFHRTELTLLQPRVVLQKGFLGVLTTSIALGQIGLKPKNDQEKPKDENLKEEAQGTMADLINETNEGRALSTLLVKLLIFDEKFYSSLVELNYPFPMRSSFEPLIIPELAIRAPLSGPKI